MGVVRHLAPVHRIADRARRAIALPRDLRADAPLRIPGEGEAALGARRFETLQPVEEEVELLLLVGVAGLGSAPRGGGLLQVVPEWGELPALREKGLPAVELGPAEVPAAEPRQDRGVQLVHRLPPRRDAFEEVQDDLALLQGESDRLSERDCCVVEGSAHRHGSIRSRSGSASAPSGASFGPRPACASA